MKILDPTSAPRPRALPLAPRPPSLRGLRLGLVENRKVNAETLLLKLADRLGRRHGTTVALVSRKRSPSHSLEEEAIRELKHKANLVISGIGD